MPCYDIMMSCYNLAFITPGCNDENVFSYKFPVHLYIYVPASLIIALRSVGIVILTLKKNTYNKWSNGDYL